ncbi:MULTISPECIES: sce7725 family protein [unclassified Lonepinella]|uniref:sce7725 family protein n=1 Tax=unclassified Lonepinella TaxID=2642006 RepID=UPI0036D9A665
MYQPYIRAKQYELIGIKELMKDIIVPQKKKISFIIEPVKDSSTLKSTIECLINNDINFTIIINPQVGSFVEVDKIFALLGNTAEEDDNYQIGVIFHNKTEHDKIIKNLEIYKKYVPALSIIHNVGIDDVDTTLNKYKNISEIKYNVINLPETSKRYHRNFSRETRVELDDYFKAQPRNSDYLDIDESNFSEEHLYYKEDGFVAFSDYLCIGAAYSESGFLPYAVAIHLSYSTQDNGIKIKHFVSDSNDDQSDIAGKFSEALNKLITWCEEKNYSSMAVDKFKELYNRGHFPGLGTIKKLSMMNHIELVLNVMVD